MMGAPVSAPRSAWKSPKNGMATAVTKAPARVAAEIAAHRSVDFAPRASAVVGETARWMRRWSGWPVMT